MKVREIDPHSSLEINLVAERMRQTLVEVLGAEKAISMYSMAWLIERVKWHLDPTNTDGKVYLIEGERGEVIGQAIARIDHGAQFGYFSTIFIEPSFRRKKLATRLIRHVEDWFKLKKMPKIIYNTAENHVALISLFKAHGYRITHSESDMVQLTKVIS